MPRNKAPRLNVCRNLVLDHSFEEGLRNWGVSGDVTYYSGQPFTGNQSLHMNSGAASLFQNVSLAGVGRRPLFLSFNVRGSQGAADLIVDVIWLDRSLRVLGVGQHMYIGAENFTGELNAPLTFFEITDLPPTQAAFAKLVFSKQEGAVDSYIDIDQVILAPIHSINLVQNHGFERGLLMWNPTNFIAGFSFPLEGGGFARGQGDGLLTQDVYIANQPPRSSYLFSFALSIPEAVAVETTVRVQWLNSDGTVISDGLVFFIPSASLLNRQAYLTYVAVTSPAPLGAVRARIRFENQGAGLFEYRIDQVLFARISLSNLVQNSSFENDLTSWDSDGVSATNVPTAYEGSWVASIPATGGSLSQQVPLLRATGRCYLLSFALKATSEEEAADAVLLARVIWVDRFGRELGLGLGLVARVGVTESEDATWSVFAAITEPAPPGTVAAKLQFSMPESSASLELDHVVFTRL